MKKSQIKKVGLMFTAGALSVTAQAHGAYSSFPFLEGFENDTDAYVPSTNPLADPPTGNPPADFNDIRGGQEGAQNGVIEEVPNGFNGLSAPDGSAHFGIVQYDKTAPGGYGSSVGPFGRPAQGGAPGPNPTPFPSGGMSAQVDFYLNAADAAGDHGWWTNAVADNTYGFYLDESGFDPIKNGDGTWNLKTTAGNTVATLPSGSWVTLESKPVDVGGKMKFENNVWSTDHTILYGSFLQTSAEKNFSDAGGPTYNWFAYGTAGVDQVFYVDNVGWAAPITLVEVPEPASLGLIGSAGLLILSRRRKA